MPPAYFAGRGFIPALMFCIKMRHCPILPDFHTPENTKNSLKSIRESGRTLKTAYTSKSNPMVRPRPISNSQLHALLHFHLCPINLIVSKGTYFLQGMGELILRGASRLDAFSVYPCPAWLPGYALGSPAGAPAAGPARSSRTKASSSQFSCAHAG